jgi:hypothetical protein
VDVPTAARQEIPVRLALAIGAVAGLAVLGGCDSAARTVPATAPSSAAVPDSAPATAAAVTAPPAAPSAAPATAWTMPTLVGSGLQDAQDAIQQLTGFGIAITHSHDVTGQDRRQVSDRNWKVCDQNVRAGATIGPDTRIDFGVAKLDESC